MRHLVKAEATRRIDDAYIALGALEHDARLDLLQRLGWRLQGRSPHQLLWVDSLRGLAVIEGREAHQRRSNTQLQLWHHVSASHRTKRLPTWDEFSELKVQFIGDDVEAYMVHPPANRYVNIHPVLHWYGCLDRPDGVLPDFRLVGPMHDGTEGVAI